MKEILFKKMEFNINNFSKVKNISYVLATLSIGSLFTPILKADQIANSSIDLKKDIENIKQKNFKNKKIWFHQLIKRLMKKEIFKRK